MFVLNDFSLIFGYSLRNDEFRNVFFKFIVILLDFFLELD